MQINSLNFHKHVIFVRCGNLTLRQLKSTGLSANKPVSSSVREAINELVRILQSKQRGLVPESLLKSTVDRVSFYIDDLPGSYIDMMRFRSDLLSMMKKHGPPSLILTLSPADTI